MSLKILSIIIGFIVFLVMVGYIIFITKGYSLSINKSKKSPTVNNSLKIKEEKKINDKNTLVSTVGVGNVTISVTEVNEMRIIKRVYGDGASLNQASFFKDPNQINDHQYYDDISEKGDLDLNNMVSASEVLDNKNTDNTQYKNGNEDKSNEESKSNNDSEENLIATLTECLKTEANSLTLGTISSLTSKLSYPSMEDRMEELNDEIAEENNRSKTSEITKFEISDKNHKIILPNSKNNFTFVENYNDSTDTLNFDGVEFE